MTLWLIGAPARRAVRVSAGLGTLWLLAAGCELVAGIESRTLGADAGATTLQIGDPLCAPGALPDPSCAESACPNGTALETSRCHCGECGHACNGTTCELGGCVPVAVTQPLPWIAAIATNGRELFVGSSPEHEADGAVYRFSLDAENAPGTGEALLEELDLAPKALAANCDSVFVASSTEHRIVQIPLSGAGLRYFTNADEQAADYRVRVMVAEANRLLWITCEGVGEDCRIRVWRGDGTVDVVADDQYSPHQLAVDGSHVYWAVWGRDSGPGQVRRAALVADGEPEPPVVNVAGADSPVAVAVDESHVYWIDWGPTGNASTAELRWAAKDGEDQEAQGRLTLGEGHPVAPLLVDAEHLFWRRSGAVVRWPKRNAGEPPSAVTGFGPSNLWAELLMADRARIYLVASAGTGFYRLHWAPK